MAMNRPGSIILSDFVGSGIDFAASKIALRDPGLILMPGSQSDDGISTLIFTPTAFVQDGDYQIKVEVYDLAGNVTIDSSDFNLNAGLQLNPFVFATSPFNGEVVDDRILSAVSAILRNSDSTSTISLSDAFGTPVPGVQSFSGDTIVYSLTAEPDSGQYTLTAIARRTGATLTDTFPATFTYSPIPPLVISTTPADGDTVIMVINSVSARLQDSDGALSTIALYDPLGDTVVGVQMTFGDTLLVLDSLTLNQIGQYMIVTIAKRGSFLTTTDTRTFQYDPPDFTLPILNVDALPSDSTTERTITRTGTIELKATVFLQVVGGGTTFVDSVFTDSVSSNAFSFVNVPLPDTGMYVFTFTGRDSAFNLSSPPFVDTVYRTIPAAFKVFISLPFNRNTFDFSVDLPSPADEVNIAVYNTGGDFVWGDSKINLPIGQTRIPWERNGLRLVNNSGDEVGNGLYIYVVTVKMLGGGEEKIKKLLMVLR